MKNLRVCFTQLEAELLATFLKSRGFEVQVISMRDIPSLVVGGLGGQYEVSVVESQFDQAKNALLKDFDTLQESDLPPELRETDDEPIIKPDPKRTRLTNWLAVGFFLLFAAFFIYVFFIPRNGSQHVKLPPVSIPETRRWGP